MFLVFQYLLLSTALWSATSSVQTSQLLQKSAKDTTDHTVIEPWTYTENFQDRDLGAWASYPLWQDIAYNQNFRINEMVPGDSNISMVQKVTPYTAVDNYAGAQKLLSMYLVPGTTLSFRYHFKTIEEVGFFKVRFAAKNYGKIDLTIPKTAINQWEWVTIGFDDIIKANPKLADQEKIEIGALAFLAKFPDADPDMPIYFGLDDVTLKGARAIPFRFSVPSMFKLPEFKPYIPKNHYSQGGVFRLEGAWAAETKEISLEIVSYTDSTKTLYQGKLSKQGATWSWSSVIDFPEGLYLGKLTAYNDRANKISDTEFTVHIAPKNIAEQHPRLLFDVEKKKELDHRFQEERFKQLYEDISVQAKTLREKIPVETLVFDLDQFPDEVWLPTWDAWGSHIYHTGSALRQNARAYAFHSDTTAGEYAKQVLLRLASWPNWTHPWQTKRGRFSEHRTGSWSHRVAEAYDLVYDLMNADERANIRRAIKENIVKGVHRTYVYNDNITAATSNWLAMTVGGSLMCQAALFKDGDDTTQIEPYFTGAIMKLHRFINKVTDSKDGGWGEGLGYNNYSFSNLSYSLTSLEQVFNIDLTQPLVGTYNEYIWAGLIKDKRWFEYGDSKGQLTSAVNWAYLLAKYKEPRLSWFYHFINDPKKPSYEDVIYHTEDIPQQDPFDEKPVKVFRDLGTTVFKGGWEADDFVFVMRTGPAYNHQHLDQGSFWLADRGKIFIEERPLSNSNYYDDPIYESWLTQPVGHSTILINGNHQSQRVGDHLNFAPGFDDHASVSHFLDGKSVAFTSGEIGKLYWGKVNKLTRNVLFLKPGAVLMLDVTEPSVEDVSVTLLYQTKRLKDINPGPTKSTIVKEDATMHVLHLSPIEAEPKAVETPHYLRTLQNVRPLEKEGMLTVTSQTNGSSIVMANLITTTTTGDEPDVTNETGDGVVSGTVSGSKYAFSTNPGALYKVDNRATDAVAISWNNDLTFVAKAREYQDDDLQLSSEEPITFEYNQDGFTYYVEKESVLTLKLTRAPAEVILNNQQVEKSSYDPTTKELQLTLPKGEGLIVINY